MDIKEEQKLSGLMPNAEAVAKEIVQKWLKDYVEKHSHTYGIEEVLRYAVEDAVAQARRETWKEVADFLVREQMPNSNYWWERLNRRAQEGR